MCQALCWALGIQCPQGVSCTAVNPLQALPWRRHLDRELSENCLLFVILTPVINKELLLFQGAFCIHYLILSAEHPYKVRLKEIIVVFERGGHRGPGRLSDLFRVTWLLWPGWQPGHQQYSGPLTPGKWPMHETLPHNMQTGSSRWDLSDDPFLKLCCCQWILRKKETKAKIEGLRKCLCNWKLWRSLSVYSWYLMGTQYISVKWMNNLLDRQMAEGMSQLIITAIWGHTLCQA